MKRERKKCQAGAHYGAKGLCAQLDERVMGTDNGGARAGFFVGTAVAGGKLITTPVFYEALRVQKLHPLFLAWCPFCGQDLRPRIDRFRAACERAWKAASR